MKRGRQLFHNRKRYSCQWYFRKPWNICQHCRG